jgi:hypothetical protein
MKKTIKANQINSVSKQINERRNAAESICREFQAVWAKVFGDEFKAAMQAAIIAAQTDKTNEAAKQRRRSLELVSAMKKSLELDKATIELVKELHANGLTFDKIRIDKIMRGLTMTRYINEQGELCERKKNKETGEYEFVPVQKWTVAKFGRLLRLSIIETIM